jgi:hypothetical protein
VLLLLLLSLLLERFQKARRPQQIITLSFFPVKTLFGSCSAVVIHVAPHVARHGAAELKRTQKNFKFVQMVLCAVKQRLVLVSAFDQAVPGLWGPLDLGVEAGSGNV